MIPAKFLETVGSGLGEQWLQRILSPAFVFWAAVALAFVDDRGLTYWEEQVRKLSTAQSILSIAGGIAVVLVTSLLMEQIRFSSLRLMEGYWGWPLRKLGRRLSAWRGQKVKAWQEEWQTLADAWESLAKQSKALTPQQMARYQELDKKLDHYPADPARAMPTRVGNILRAAEEYSARRYGLAGILMYPRLWLIMPTESRTELATAHRGLYEATAIAIYGIAFAFFARVALWTLPAGVLVAFLAYRRLLEASINFGGLLRSAYDLYHRKIYEALQWEVPGTNETESLLQGRQVTQFIKRGKRPTPSPPQQTGLIRRLWKALW